MNFTAGFPVAAAGRSAGQAGADPARPEQRPGVRQPAGEDLLAVPPGQVAQVGCGGQLHVVWRPGQADRQRRIACPGFPGRPAQRLSGAGGPVVTSHDPVCRPGHVGTSSTPGEAGFFTSLAAG